MARSNFAAEKEAFAEALHRFQVGCHLTPTKEGASAYLPAHPSRGTGAKSRTKVRTGGLLFAFTILDRALALFPLLPHGGYTGRAPRLRARESGLRCGAGSPGGPESSASSDRRCQRHYNRRHGHGIPATDPAKFAGTGKAAKSTHHRLGCCGRRGAHYRVAADSGGGCASVFAPPSGRYTHYCCGGSCATPSSNVNCDLRTMYSRIWPVRATHQRVTCFRYNVAPKGVVITQPQGCDATPALTGRVTNTPTTASTGATPHGEDWDMIQMEPTSVSPPP